MSDELLFKFNAMGDEERQEFARSIDEATRLAGQAIAGMLSQLMSAETLASISRCVAVMSAQTTAAEAIGSFMRYAEREAVGAAALAVLFGPRPDVEAEGVM